MSILWHHGVRTGRLTANEFVRITSTNTAQIFNIYPRKGSVRSARMPIWWSGIPQAGRTISAKTHHQNVDFNVYEGMEVEGCARHTIAGAIWSGPRGISARRGAPAAMSIGPASRR